MVKTKNEKQKVKGAAGSGKTYVLSKRAINIARRLNNNAEILILCYNITMVPHIVNIINSMRNEIYLQNFTINYYHQYIQ